MRTKMIVAFIALAFTIPQPAAADVAMNPFRSNAPLQKSPYVELTHGFHCRPMYGWDPRLGIYHRHSHPGICADYQRCLKVMYRCDLVRGKGWEPWSYERWGFDNWRFDKCMLNAGCY